MRTFLSAASALALAGCITAGAQTLEGVAAATYELEKNHAFLSVEVSHNGLSDYIIDFTDFDATMTFDPADPTASTLNVSVNPLALDTQYPDAAKKAEWETELSTDAKWLNGNEFPAVTFTSTSVEQTGDFTGTVTGDFTLLGVTKPITFDVTYNGTGNAPWFGPRDLIGFDAKAVITRSEFGMDTFTPNIGDEVTINFTGEFLQAEE
ncbi:MAG: YceI family protein [Pseudomonadota bacterium]